MAPVRTHDAVSTADPKSTHERPHKRRRVQTAQSTEPSAPGVSKLKASLRQTRRLLAKDFLAADVRVDTERRLHALEAELAAAEQANKERAMATKYHRIKFFDRKKLLRRVKQVQRQLGAEELSSKERKKLERTLGDLRVDLNYVTHYPKAERYISLFPPEVRQHDHDSEEAHTVEPIHMHKGQEPENATDKRREELRAWIRERMEAGEFAREPEVGGDPEQDEGRRSIVSAPQFDSGKADTVMEGGDEEQSDAAPTRPKAKKIKRRKSKGEEPDGSSANQTTETNPAREEHARPTMKHKNVGTRSKTPRTGEGASAKIGLAGDDFFGDD
ncbi:unnamed protein product [Peniophora sp. CBMAI 1063]|nr:unnamed protein product [Peniophora sp. CBMAI 1063]